MKSVFGDISVGIDGMDNGFSFSDMLAESEITKETMAVEEEVEHKIPDLITDEQYTASIMAQVNRPHAEDYLKMFKSGIGLDISKNHTGIAIWKDGKLTTEGFAVDMDFDYKSSYLAEARMRKLFKEKLIEYLKDYEWEVCVVEDIYFGRNADTVRKLCALNCVVDELVLDGVLKIENIYRFKEAEWLRNFRKIIKFGTKLDPKYECQKILEYLDFDFLMENKSIKKADKARIFYEDRCDAAGQLISLALYLSDEAHKVKGSSVKLRNLTMRYFEEAEDMYYGEDTTYRNAEVYFAEYQSTSVEDNILKMMEEHPKEVVVFYVSSAELGIFGLKNGFPVYESGYGYLAFYNRKTVEVD